MTKVSLAVVTALTSGMFASTALADLYIGGKVGYSSTNESCHLSKGCDDDSASAALHLGYDFNDYFALEYGVDYLGDFRSNFDTQGKNTIDGRLSAISLAPKLSLALTDSWDVFAKLGGAYMISGDDRDIVPTASVGVEYKLNYNWDIRAEYQRYENMSDNIINDMDVNFFGIGVNYRFGSEPVVEQEPVVEARPAAKIVEHVYPAQIETIRFSFDSKTTEATLRNTIEVLNTYPQSQVEITGYTDSTGSEKYNQKLSEKRAQSVADSLKAQGIDEQRMTVKGLGEHHPAESNETKVGRETNRRVEVVVPSFQYTTTE
ncbi:outer membrane beta-barrel protein [Vibrio owensii]|uniref:outer membrane beta-barrel protein n=1 Tax=Vibrio owensii TaxID=696485 RepID=UPI003AACF8B3